MCLNLTIILSGTVGRNASLRTLRSCLLVWSHPFCVSYHCRTLLYRARRSLLGWHYSAIT